MDWELAKRVFFTDFYLCGRYLKSIVGDWRLIWNKWVVFSHLIIICFIPGVIGIILLEIFDHVNRLSSFIEYVVMVIMLLFAPLLFGLVLLYSIKILSVFRSIASYPWKRSKKDPLKSRGTSTKKIPPVAYEILHERSYRWFFRGLVLYTASITTLLIIEDIMGIRVDNYLSEPTWVSVTYEVLINHTPFSILTILLKPFSGMGFANSMILFIIGVLPALLFASSFRSLSYIYESQVEKMPRNMKIVIGTVAFWLTSIFILISL
ncbi:hypothetical protein [Natronosalvus vescus]|uniref:hypothetical protein n=1 Tax=Natronosalvus vescus TaxID=2953881 RepID=UPI0020911096|nr:hypothetical protein [Natronosalvus vescus]